jgi:hypothetical protein
VWELLKTVANTVFGAGSAAAAAWVKLLNPCLEEESVAPVPAALSEPAPPTADAADEVRKATARIIGLLFVRLPSRIRLERLISPHTQDV